MEELISRRWMVREEELDDEQYKVRMLKEDNYLIEGCAGSGKTILALQKAKEIQDANMGTYLVIVYTITLRSFIKDGVTQLELDPDRVCNYHQLKNNGFESADYIIVDEILDFSEDEINRLYKMANKHFIFFGDDAQQIYSRKTGDMTLMDICNISSINSGNHKLLKNNYRLPRSIAEFASNISTTNDKLVERCIKESGEKPMILKHKSFEQELEYIFKIIKNEEWLDVAILVDTNYKVKEVKDYCESKGIEIEWKYNEEDDKGWNQRYTNIDFYTEKVKVMTYHSSKGLQFEHVFIPSCEINTTDYNYKEALYVAVTRTSETLFISYTDRLSHFISLIDQKFYDYQMIE